MHKCRDARIHGCTDAGMHRCTNAQVHGGTDALNGCTVEFGAWTDGWMDGTATRNQTLLTLNEPSSPAYHTRVTPWTDIPHPRSTNACRHFFSEKKEMARSV